MQHNPGDNEAAEGGFAYHAASMQRVRQEVQKSVRKGYFECWDQEFRVRRPFKSLRLPFAALRCKRAIPNPHGAVAQLGERYTGSVEVRGSIPLGSTNATARDLWFRAVWRGASAS